MYLSEGGLILSPSDLNGFVSCPHLTTLDLRLLNGEIEDDKVRGAEAELLSRKGDQHERAYLDGLRHSGREVVEIADSRDQSPATLRARAAETEAAMRAGAEVIFQGTFFQEHDLGGVPHLFRGHTDFLFRRDDRPSGLGTWSYEVADTKLARRTKPYFILQLCFYSEMLERVQGVAPERISVILGDTEKSERSYRLAEFAAYFRRIRLRFLRALAERAGTYPEPVEHCSVCAWRERCERQWAADDHLKLVAGITRRQRERLAGAGIDTVAALGNLAPGQAVDGLRGPQLEKLREQAALQLEAREHPEALPEPRLLPLEKGRGFARLPEPSPGDIFFDIEGDPFFEGGLEYLFGLVTCDGDGGAEEPAFDPIWGRDRGEEKRAVEKFIDLVNERRRRWPDLHVYHYNHYEVTALKRLCQSHGTREEELDDLLRNGVFADLLKVVREGMRLGLPGYGLKEVEAYFMPKRETEVSDGGDSVVEFERWLDGDRDPGDPILAAIAAYNRDDCISTLRLRDWLLGLRERAAKEYGADIPWFARPEREGGEESARQADERAEAEHLRDALLDGLPEDSVDDDEKQAAQRLLAHLLGYHRREALPVWWKYFDRLDRDPEELVDDAECLGGLRPVEGAEPEVVDSSHRMSFTYPPQETKLGSGTALDPALSKADGKPRGINVDAIDPVNREVKLKRGTSRAHERWPSALIPGRPFGTSQQRGALQRLAASVLEHGLAGPGPHRAARDLLCRRPPRTSAREPGAPLHGEPATLDELHEVVGGLDDSYLMIQGPPGSGKTWSAARLIVRLIENGNRIGVTSTSHKAIHNLLDKVDEHAHKEGVSFRGLKLSGSGSPYESGHGLIGPAGNNAELMDESLALTAGTAWHYCREEVGGTVDYLFVDEAGQISLADALALSTCARNVVLLGDPQQLPQVSQGRHPGGSDRSVLEHLLGDDQTIPPERGVFLGESWRMHPDVCAFVSELMYDGRLRAAPGRERQRIIGGGALEGTGTRWLPVSHDGNAQSSEAEAERIAALLRDLRGARYVDCDGEEHPLEPKDVLVVTPFNAQVKCLEAALPKDTRIGTVDKFQGQSAQVVLYSMASSSGDDVPRGLEFLFSRNRLNVAMSRAKCVAALVCSPALLDVTCRTVDQMRLVNAVCTLAEDP